MHISKASIHEYPDLEQGIQKAQGAAAATGGKAFPCTLFDQGGRTVAVTSFSMATLRQLLIARPATRGEDPHDKNRPLDSHHVRAIRDYLVGNRNSYVLPPFSIAYRERLSVFTVQGGAKTRAGFIVIPDGVQAQITDGQHRYYAIVGIPGARKNVDGALDLCPELLDDAVAVQIAIEDDVRRSHQDFADMAQTKALPKSLLTAYDLRDPINLVVANLIENSRLFKGRVDQTSPSLSKGSRKLILSNWVRNLVKGTVARDYFVADEQLAPVVKERLETDDQVRDLETDLMLVIDSMTDQVSELAQIAALDPEAPEADKVPELRSRTLAATAVGLGIAGMVLKAIRTHSKSPDETRAMVKRLYSEIDWSRTGNKIDEVWVRGGILSGGTSIKAARQNIFISTARILQRLGLPLTDRFEKTLTKAETATA